MPERPFILRPYERDRWAAASLYVLQFSDAPEPELFRLFRSEAGARCTDAQRAICRTDTGPCRGACRRSEHLTALNETLDVAITTAGFRPEFFRPFDHYPYPTAAVESGRYRLLGLRFDSDVFVAGGGGPKFVRALGQDPALKAALADVQYAARHLRERMKRRGLDHPPRDDRDRLHLPDDLLDFSHLR